KMGSEGKSIREMARELGRGPSTVSREVRRGLFSAGAAGTVAHPRGTGRPNYLAPAGLITWRQAA
ncbi:MAG: helix-turn-helix domain-containing protein, partial [Bifidobacteriaceae bacterium]|nr:helix-turn-helix domain-containing protein [Bifidobacteriaceae bacterium]